jgi:hypothetical protein
MGSNPYLFWFIKHGKRGSSKMSSTEHLLSSSSSLNKKEVLNNHGGGNFLEVGKVFERLWQLFVTLKHGTYLHYVI